MSRRAIGALVAVVASVPAVPHANRSATATLMPVNGQRHHYTIGGRVRALLFWVGKDDVGDAIIAKKQDSEGVAYALLIGADPERAPRRINNWGYLSEEIHRGEATLVGLMAESDEQSIDEAQASLKAHTGERTFNAISESVVDGQARSIVTSVAVPADYTFRHVDAVIDLAEKKGVDGQARMLQLPAGTRPGFLSALADLIHGQATQWRTAHVVSTGEPLGYVYQGTLYQLRATRSVAVHEVRAGSGTVTQAIASRFEIRNLISGELTEFSATYAVDGPLAEMPLTATYRPRWWLEINLTLDDTVAGPVPVTPVMDNSR